MYRKITVNNIEYKYVIGKTHTKIVDVGAFLNSDISKQLTITEHCECCGSAMSTIYSSHVDQTKIAVTPGCVAKKIKLLFPTEDTLMTLKCV